MHLRQRFLEDCIRIFVHDKIQYKKLPLLIRKLLFSKYFVCLFLYINVFKGKWKLCKVLLFKETEKREVVQ